MINVNTPDIDIARQVKSALDNLEGVEKDKEFWGFIKGLPTMLLQDGLLQTLAFIQTKVKSGEEGQKYRLVFTAFNDFARKRFQIPQEQNIIEYLVIAQMPLEKYVFIQQQMLDYAIWFKRIGLALKADPSVR